MPQSWRRPQHQKQTSDCRLLMSAIPPKADISVVLLRTLHDVGGDEMTLIFGETLA
jgi:hypothetical protein